MFGLLSAGVSLAGLGMSAIQAIKANKTIKQEQAKSDALLNQAGSMTRQNQYAGLQAPDVSSLGYQQNQQLMTQGIDTLGGLGAEGAAGVAGLFESARQANLKDTQTQAEMNYQRDLTRLGEQSAIDKEDIARQESILSHKLGQTNQNMQNAYYTKNQAIGGMFESALGAMNFAKQDFDPSTGQYLGRGYNDKGSMTKEQSEGLNLLLRLINKPS